jgi:hypothetical protein
MKTKLAQLTAAKFIELVCGNKDVLLGKHEVPNFYKLTIAMRTIVMEYRGIADPGGNASYLQHVETLIKARISVAVFSMCQNLVFLNQYDKAREILIAAGLPADGWSAKRMASAIHIQLQKNKRVFDEIEENEDIVEDKENIRNAFDGMIAAMMAQFKFQIDIGTMMAPVFAHLVARYHAEMKAMKRALKPR